MISELTARNCSMEELASSIYDHPDPPVALFARRFLGDGASDSELAKLRDENAELKSLLDQEEDDNADLKSLLEDIRDQVDLPKSLQSRVDDVL